MAHMVMAFYSYGLDSYRLCVMASIALANLPRVREISWLSLSPVAQAVGDIKNLFLTQKSIFGY